MIWLPGRLSTEFGFGLTQPAPRTAVTVLGMACGMIGRGVGGFGRLVIGALAASCSFAIALLATISILDIVATIALIPERRGQTVEWTARGRDASGG
jgi:hypothetical protein